MANTANNSLVQKNNDQPKYSLWITGDQVKANILKRTQSEVAAKRFITGTIALVAMKPELQKCDFASIVSAGLQANELHLSLSPSLGQAHLVPFNDKKNGTTNATFVVGWRGYVQLALRSRYYKKIIVNDVKEGEILGFDIFNEEIIPAKSYINIDERDKTT